MRNTVRLLGPLLLALSCHGQAGANVIVTLQQVGPDVVATASGTINLAGLTNFGTGNEFPYFDPRAGGWITVGATGRATTYGSILSGPNGIGVGSATFATSGTGDLFYVDFNVGSGIGVPENYVSGSSIDGSARWDGKSLADLGAIPGTYTWTLPNNIVTLTINGAPEPGTLALLGLGLAGLAASRRRRQ